jgi:aspartate carbamoyltransferase regulatory subunit
MQTSKPGDIWQVRAPSFAFRVTEFFAMQIVTIPGRANDAVKCSNPNPVYSTPMHITKDMKITSDVTITIQCLAGEEDPTMWSLEPVFKSVP